MRYGYSILMFCFAGGILLYAALVAPGNVDLIRRRHAVKIENPKAYAKQFAKVLALVSLSPLSSGVVGLLLDIERHPFPPVVTLIAVFVVCMWRGVRIMDDVS